MSRQLGTFAITNVIVHDVPKSVAGRDQDLVLSEVESALDGDLADYFSRKILSSLNKVALDAVVDMDGDKDLPPLILRQLDDEPDDFLAMSQEAAQYLDRCQSGRNSAGLLVVMRGQIDDLPCLGIMKLERQEGVQLNQTEIGGKRTFDMQQVRDLMLTEDTKVFKVALFTRTGPEITDIQALVSDQQRGSHREVADFFLKRFLGCQLRELPQVTTRRFFETTMSFIQSGVSDPDLKVRYQMALVAEMNSQRPTITPVDFVHHHLVGTHRDALAKRLDDERIPMSGIEKDVTLVDNQLRKMIWRFDGGLALVGPPDQFEGRVDVDRGADGSRTIIRDEIKNVSSR